MVKELSLQKINVTKIKFDKTNPNKMTDKQMEGLKATMEKYGYLTPVILNKDFTVIDGEHRARIYKDLGKKTIQAYVLDIKKVDAKVLRQVMNKLKGEHNFEKDTLEFELIKNAGELKTLAELLAQPERVFNTQINLEEDFKGTEVKVVDELATDSECPKCGYKW